MLQIAKLNKALENSSVQVGDVLRGVTCTNFVYEVTAVGSHHPSQAYGHAIDGCPNAKLMHSVDQSSMAMAWELAHACFQVCAFLSQTQALWGAAAPKRTIVLYGADKQKWPQVMGALKKGDRSDGHVTLIVERRLEGTIDLDTGPMVKETSINY